MSEVAKGRLVLTAKVVAAAAVLGWAWLIFAYFLRTNFQLVHNAVQPLGVFSALFGRYTFSLANTPPLEVAQALMVLAMTQAFGLLTLRIFRLRLGGLSRYALAFPIGFGLSGIAFELLTMAGLLYPVAAWLLWAALLGGAWAAARWRRELFDSPIIAGRAVDVPCDCPMPPLAGMGRLDLAFWCAAVGIAALITAAIFWHAAFFPETYWDSLILYLGYSRMTFLQHAFPFKAEVQVGIGLGANYPHLFGNYGAMASTLFAHWSDLHLRLAAPVAGMCAAILVYTTVLNAWGSHAVAAAAMLLFRAVPNGIAYSTYASDYAFALLFIAAMVLAVSLFARRPTAGTLAAMSAIPAIAMHLNYLMGLLWIGWLFAVVMVVAVSGGAGFVARLRRTIFTRVFLAIYLTFVALSLPWHIRNMALTGNPVYAFFPEIFTSSINMNVEVLRSSELEWYRNGDGIGRMAEWYRGKRTGEIQDEGDPSFERRATFRDRVDGTFPFWIGFDALVQNPDGTIRRHGAWRDRLAILLGVNGALGVLPWPTTIQAYKMMILIPALLVPALLLGAVWLGYRWSRGAAWSTNSVAAPTIATSAFLTLSFLGYMYFLADFYLYQIVGFLSCAAVASSVVGVFLIRDRAIRVWAAPVFYALVLLQGIAPGLAFSLMGFKYSKSRVIDGQSFTQGNLDVFRNPGLPQSFFLRMQYGEDVDMWDYVNAHHLGQTILTHENRHYVFDPSITFVHLDDWAIQQEYGKTDAAEIAAFLRGRGLEYYLRVPNEANHPILARLGMDRVEKAGLLEEVARFGDNALFRIVDPVSR